MARFSVNPFSYDHTGNCGISLGLANVQIVKRNMPRLDGRAPANKEFGTVEEVDDNAPSGFPGPAFAPNGATAKNPF
jgi:hypothetical protein